MIKEINRKSLREFAIKKRNEMANCGLIQKKAYIITEKIINSSDFKNAQHIGLYHSFKNEIDISAIVIEGKNFYLPRCIKNFGLEFCPFSCSAELKNGKYGIKEPVCASINPEILDLIYVPALMVNSKNFRLGYGKGYYDKFFSSHNLKAKKIAIVPKELISDSFIENENDYPLNDVISA